MDAEAFRRFEQAGHDRLAATYGDFFAANTAHAIGPLLDAVRVRAGAAVLDVACGPGHVAAAAAARGARVTGVDLSAGMIAVASRAHPAITFRAGDAEALPFADGAFDAVVCNFGIGHFPRAEVAAGEAARVLAPGGRWALTWWGDPAGSRINGMFLDAVAAAGAQPPADLPPGPPAFRFAEDAALLALLRGAGLAEAHVTALAWVHHTPTLDAWWDGGLGAMLRVGSIVGGQPPETRRRIRAEFERLAAACAAEGGGYDIPNVAKLAAGTKR